jgi:hypothetical protein
MIENLTLPDRAEALLAALDAHSTKASALATVDRAYIETAKAQKALYNGTVRQLTDKMRRGASFIGNPEPVAIAEGDTLESVRVEIARLENDIRHLRDAPETADDYIARSMRLYEHIERDKNGLVKIPDGVERSQFESFLWAANNLDTHRKNVTAYARANLPDGKNKAERDAEIAELQAARFELERKEEHLVRAALGANQLVWRRAKVDPCALLDLSRVA